MAIRLRRCRDPGPYTDTVWNSLKLRIRFIVGNVDESTFNTKWKNKGDWKWDLLQVDKDVTPSSPISFVDIASEWKRFLHEAGAVKWENSVKIAGKTVEQLIKEDIQAYGKLSGGHGPFSDSPFLGKLAIGLYS